MLLLLWKFFQDTLREALAPSTVHRGASSLQPIMPFKDMVEYQVDRVPVGGVPRGNLGSVAAMYAIINVSTVFPLFTFDADLSRHYGCLPESSVSVSRRIDLVGCPLTL